MKNKIGFIDKHLNNFHSNLYVKLIREGKFKDDFDVALAYGDAESCGMDTAKWCQEYNVNMAKSIEQVVDECDKLIILSPDNPERHWDLSEYALKSGKACYIDKTFAPDFATAKKLIDLAQANNTPMFSTSALRFVPELNNYLDTVGKERKTKLAETRGPGAAYNYSVHSVEPLVMLLGLGAKSVTYHGNEEFSHFNIDYPDDRIGSYSMYHSAGSIGDVYYGHPFEASVLFDGGSTALHFNCDLMFDELVNRICRFFLGEESPAPTKDTLEVMAILDASARAMASPGTTAIVRTGEL